MNGKLGKAVCLLVLGLSANVPWGAVVAQEQAAAKFAIAIHGGAGGDPAQWSETYRQARRDGLQAALDKGVAMLSAGGQALDVVEQVVRLMEDNEVFNAGRGCVLNEQGTHELDASIMDGRDLSCGAVARVTATKNPISLARRVMTDTRHILLSGDGADQFSLASGLEQAPADYFRTPRQLANWQRWKQQQADDAAGLQRPRDAGLPELYYGTVGCVVLDSHGNLAAATSTGGLMGKRWGRVGDSPIIGAGNYADNGTCAVSGTGIGEEFIRHAVASDIAARIRYGRATLAEAAAASVAQLPEAGGGVICVDRSGNIRFEFNTPGMSRGFATSAGDTGIMLGKDD